METAICGSCILLGEDAFPIAVSFRSLTFSIHSDEKTANISLSFDSHRQVATEERLAHTKPIASSRTSTMSQRTKAHLLQVETARANVGGKSYFFRVELNVLGPKGFGTNIRFGTRGQLFRSDTLLYKALEWFLENDIRKWFALVTSVKLLGYRTCSSSLRFI